MIAVGALVGVLFAVAPLEHRSDAAITAAVADAARGFLVPRSRVPRSLVPRSLVRRESSFRPHALSRAGACGLMQVMPANAARLGVGLQDLWDPTKNILAGTRLLAVLLRHYRGDVISALVAYNARPRRLFAPLPRNGETPEYVRHVLAYYEAYQHDGLRTLPVGSRRSGPTRSSSRISALHPRKESSQCLPTTTSN